MGDPVGIGPEIILKVLVEKSVYETCRPLVLGDVAVMTATNQRLRTGLRIRPVDAPEAGLYQSGSIDVIGLSHLDYGQLQYGHPTQETGRAMVAYVTRGIDWAMKGRIHGLATCPINKLAMHMAGIDFDGHTELLAQRTKTSEYVMMLAGSRLRVALATIHLPLARVPEKLTTEVVFKTIRITEEALRNSFGIPRPKLAVAALNPHAGENGLFGDEETRVISPALRRAAEAGIHVSGPYPADTLFYWALKGRWDAVIAMYHDQGLIPFKMVHFPDGVNTTLGLPIVRTSVDHGTAYDIAGAGKANPGSLVAAIQMAAQHAMHRAQGRGRRAEGKLQ
ncbi:MAG: 4-hydroxythreonine-4-phosphate dehydrogenase PdxA [Deltaproteobacteria bacterium]|nr:4-hydroxythreonine-4-phosphate dehydrogenase PdxA [Deltaproteobacteria bacterium]MBW1793970.1 4-hydroxythreonine-4-phosphate dehydrogenase PdxA [Deltaproteobacteria bacterium]